ncbi:MAG: hypothetical protein WDW38_004050 [Sanguina aurantia]
MPDAYVHKPRMDATRAASSPAPPTFIPTPPSSRHGSSPQEGSPPSKLTDPVTGEPTAACPDRARAALVTVSAPAAATDIGTSPPLLTSLLALTTATAAAAATAAVAPDKALRSSLSSHLLQHSNSPSMDRSREDGSSPHPGLRPSSRVGTVHFAPSVASDPSPLALQSQPGAVTQLGDERHSSPSPSNPIRHHHSRNKSVGDVNSQHLHAAHPLSVHQPTRPGLKSVIMSCDDLLALTTPSPDTFGHNSHLNSDSTATNGSGASLPAPGPLSPRASAAAVAAATAAAPKGHKAGPHGHHHSSAHGHHHNAHALDASAAAVATRDARTASVALMQQQLHRQSVMSEGMYISYFADGKTPAATNTTSNVAAAAGTSLVGRRNVRRASLDMSESNTDFSSGTGTGSGTDLVNLGNSSMSSLQKSRLVGSGGSNGESNGGALTHATAPECPAPLCCGGRPYQFRI